MIGINKIVKFFNEHEGEYTSEDYLIICGDVGVCGFYASEEAETRRVFRNLPVTTLFIDGNHENFEQLNSMAGTLFCNPVICHLTGMLLVVYFVYLLLNYCSVSL